MMSGPVLPPPPPGLSGWPWDEDPVPCAPAMPDGRPWPRITIVTPSFNQGAFIEETIRSVLLQGYPNLEYIVMDGGSTDETVAILKRYTGLLTWISERDRGQCDAINKGFTRATGAYLAWINSDDYYLPGAFFHLAATMAGHGCDFVYGDVMRLKSGVLNPCGARQTNFDEMMRTVAIPIPQPSSMWTQSAWRRVGGLNDIWQCVLDRDLFIRFSLDRQPVYVPGFVAVSRIHPECKSEAMTAVWLTEMPRLYRELFARRDLPANVAKLRRETFCRMWLYCVRVAAKCDRARWPYWCAAFWSHPPSVVAQFTTWFRQKRETSPGYGWRILRYVNRRRWSERLASEARSAVTAGRPFRACGWALLFLCSPPHHRAVSKWDMVRLVLRGGRQNGHGSRRPAAGPPFKKIT